MDSLLEKRVYDNANDIAEVSKSVIRLSTLMEESEKRRIDDRETLKEAIKAMSEVRDSVSKALGMEKDISAVREGLAAVRHDLANARQSLTALPSINEKLSDITSDIASLQTDVDNLKTWKAEITGGVTVVSTGAKIFWAIFGGLIISGAGALLLYLVRMYLENKEVISGY